MLVAVDLDGVVLQFDAQWRRLYQEWFDLEPPEDQSWDSFVTGTVMEDDIEFFTWFDGARGWDNMPYVPGAPAGLVNLLNLGHTIRFVTARQTPEAVQATQAWHAASLWSQCQLFTGISHKASVPANVYIDDSPDVAASLAEAGRQVLLYDQPWNEGVEDTELITRVKGWREVTLAVERLADSGSPKAPVRAQRGTRK